MMVIAGLLRVGWMGQMFDRLTHINTHSWGPPPYHVGVCRGVRVVFEHEALSRRRVGTMSTSVPSGWTQ